MPFYKAIVRGGGSVTGVAQITVEDLESGINYQSINISLQHRLRIVLFWLSIPQLVKRSTGKTFRQFNEY